MLHASQRPPRHADCRGGVFATRRFPRPLPPYAHPMPHMAMGGFYNDAACRVVIPPSRLPPMGAYGHYHGTGREGTRKKGGYSWVGGQLAARPYGTSPTKRAIANLAN